MEKLRLQRNTYLPFLNRLKQVYADMDQKYNEVANDYGFHCTGCEDNCCLTRFYHHTFLEFLYIMDGYNTLAPEKQIAVKERALAVSEETADLDKKGLSVRLMCPLNMDGLCILYDFRPMICRLHGISHELRRPDGKVMYGPGCEEFTKQCENKGYIRFDRTPFYIQMAQLERELKEAIGMTQKIKMTVAEMLLEICDLKFVI